MTMTADDPKDTEAPTDLTSEAPDAGWVMLQKARIAAGLEIETLAAVLKVSVRKLQALEAGELNNPSELTFTRALAASVCRQLRIDSNEILAAWPGPSSQTTVVPSALPADGAPSAATALPPEADAAGGRKWLGVVVVLAISVGAWLAYQQMQHASERRQIKTQQQVIEVPTTQPAPAPAPDEPNIQTAPPAGAPEPVLAPAPERPPEPTAAAVESPPAGTVAILTKTAPLTPAEIGQHVLVFQAQQESWVEVTNASGGRVFTRLMSPGDYVTIDEKGVPLSVLVGNAVGVRAYSRGKAVDLVDKSRLNVARFEIN